MLSIAAMSAGQASYYLELSTREDYYLGEYEPSGQWYGKAAAALGLQGGVEPRHLYNLFAGRSPEGDVSLIQRQKHSDRGEHRPGWDLTFSAPKSVSVLWSQGDVELRSAIERIHDGAVRSALDYLQDNAAFTRRGKRGSVLEKTGVLAALFEHSTSRAMDPNLHTHALLLNLSVREDGTTGTFSSLEVFNSKMTAGALYRAELASGLQNVLGLNLRRERSWFEVDGVSKALTGFFSKRRKDIEEQLTKTGLSSAEASAQAAIQTRDKKESMPREALFEKWQKEGAALGWGREAAKNLLNAWRPGRERLGDLIGPGMDDLCQKALRAVTTDKAHFGRRELTRLVAEEAQTFGFGAKEVREGTERFLSGSSKVVRLGIGQTRETFTSQAVMELEGTLLKDAKVLAERTWHPAVERPLAEESLNDEQREAVRHLVYGTRDLALVAGMAGTGKTRMLQEATHQWKNAGYEVFGACTSANAAQELGKATKMDATSIAKLLYDIKRGERELTTKSVLIVDEAAMVSTVTMKHIFDQCIKGGSKLALIGDERQVPAIGPGAPFKVLGDMFGRKELKEIKRQRDGWARDAVTDMAKGNVREALHEFAKRGLVNAAENKEEAFQRLIEDWKKDPGWIQDKLILASTRDDVARLNELAQKERFKAGKLDGPKASVGEQSFFQGDRVMFTQNHKKLGVTNGARGDVVGVSLTGKKMTVRLDSGKRVSIPVATFQEVELGYAVTTHKAQGMTVDRAYVYGSGELQNREMTYVQLSRATDQTRIYATRLHLGDALVDLAKSMEKSRRNEIAHSFVKPERPAKVIEPDGFDL